MNSATQELIEETISKIDDRYSPEEKKRFAEMLYEIVEHGEVPYKALGFTPKLLERIYGYAQRLYASGKYQDACIIFDTLVQLNKSNPIYHLGLAASCHMQKKYDQALIHYYNCYELDSKNPMPIYHASDCCINLNQPESALQCLEATILLCGNLPQYAKIKQRAVLIRDGLKQKVNK